MSFNEKTASSSDDLQKRYVRKLSDTMSEVELLVPTMHCAACMSKIEKGMALKSGVIDTRANLSTKRVSVKFTPDKADMDQLIADMEAVGFSASPFSAEQSNNVQDETAKELLKCLAVAGFAYMNIMLFSVSVWAGGGMEGETKTMFHWISGIISISGISYSGRPFFRSAVAAIRAGGVNMDVPISLAVVLSALASVYETYKGGDQVFFDAGVMLLFFLLIGRYLDQRMRAKASDAAQNLLALKAVPATVIDGDGQHRTVPADLVEVGSTALVATGMRIPVDGFVIDGTSDIDSSLVTGETLPEQVSQGSKIYAGTLNITAPIKIEVTGGGEETFLAEIVRLMETAEQSRSKYVRLADKMASLYAPVVHILALATFLGWLWAVGDWHMPLMRAIAVLIITCPCALGLAVPVVQVVASGRLLAAGVLVKSGDALERLALVDTVVFDKTGTLTNGELQLLNALDISSTNLRLAAGLGMTSRHPLSQAVARAAGDVRLPMMDKVEEIPGAGLIGEVRGKRLLLGSREHVGVTDDTSPAEGPELWLKIDDASPTQFRFADTLRTDAAETMQALKAMGMDIHMLSGDREEVVIKTADELGLSQYEFSCKPDEKIDVLKKLKESGKTVLMVGDGLNDAPALMAADASISPATATDVTQNAADFVFQGHKLGAVVEAIAVAQKTRRLVFENFGLAIGYNVIAVPLAVLGYVTPLVAAIAMSTSSIIVTVNALRLRVGQNKTEKQES